MSIQNIKDRVPNKVLGNGAIRYGIYDENGNLSRYEYIKREDEPLEVGTVINKKTINNLQGDLYTSDRYSVPEISEGIAQSFSGDYWYPNKYESLTLVRATTPDNYSITNLFNTSNDVSTYMDGTAGKTGGFVIKNTKKIRIKQIGIKGHFSTSDERNPKVFKIYGSNDNSEWTQLYAHSTEIKTTLATINVNSADFYKYIKFEFNFAKSTVWIDRLYMPSCEYKNSVFNINLPLTSYEKGKIVNIICPEDLQDGGSIDINGLGEKHFSGRMMQNGYYSLVYNGESWDVTGATVVTGSFNGTTSLQTISLGFTPDLVVCYSSANNVKGVGDGTGSPNYKHIPRILTKTYESSADGAITGSGFTYTVTSVTTVYYIAIKF